LKKTKLRLGWDFAYSNMSWACLMRARFLKNKYCKIVLYKSSLVWLGIADWYDSILENTHWQWGKGQFLK